MVGGSGAIRPGRRAVVGGSPPGRRGRVAMVARLVAVVGVVVLAGASCAAPPFAPGWPPGGKGHPRGDQAWPMYGYGPEATSNNVAEHVVGVRNVGNLTTRAVCSAGFAPSGFVVADGVAYYQSLTGTGGFAKAYLFARPCGGTGGSSWVSVVEVGLQTPAVVNGVVYAKREGCDRLRRGERTSAVERRPVGC